MSINNIFSSVLSSTDSSFHIVSFLLCIVVAMGLGFFIAWNYARTTKHTKSFVTTLALLPSVVSMIIMMVNGNVGTGVAVAGAFSLVRFRSVPGSAKEIGAIFVAMGTGLAVGIGYLGLAIIFVLLVVGFDVLLNQSGFGGSDYTKRTLMITIPEDLNYTTIFDDLFLKYTKSVERNFVKTSNMGSMYKLSYDIELKDMKKEKEFIDELRCRNGNLEIKMMQQSSAQVEL